MRRLILLLFIFILFLTKATKTYATEASLTCQPTTGTYKVGDTFTVDYILNTRSFQIFGAVVVATYTTSVIEAVGSQSTPITTDTHWTNPVTNTIDSTLGKIQLDYGSSQTAYTSTGSIGQVTFRAKAAGQAQFVYTFMQSKDNTTPGVAKAWGKPDGSTLENVLTDVNNCVYVIEAEAVVTPSPTTTGPTPTTPTTPTTPPSVPTATISVLPRTGSFETTAGLLGISGLFIAIGTLVPAFASRKRV